MQARVQSDQLDGRYLPGVVSGTEIRGRDAVKTVTCDHGLGMMQRRRSRVQGEDLNRGGISSAQHARTGMLNEVTTRSDHVIEGNTDLVQLGFPEPVDQDHLLLVWRMLVCACLVRSIGCQIDLAISVRLASIRSCRYLAGVETLVQPRRVDIRDRAPSDAAF